MIEYHFNKLADYPLKQNMTKDKILAVPSKKLIDAGMHLANIIADSYDGTPYYVDLKLTNRLLQFITLLRHTGGSLGGAPFRLLPFQIEFMVEVLCVLDRKTNLRKVREAILHIPRKSGKTEFGAALNLVMMFMDKENQKEIYSIATDVSQASILYYAVVSMLKQNPTLQKRIKQYKAERKLQRENGIFVDLYKVLSATAGTKDGLKPNVLYFDEMHAYPDSALYDVMVEGTAHREQPLTFILSTAGYNKNGVYYRKLQYAKQVMMGVIDNPKSYLMYFGLEDDEDWTTETNWVKCNPALGYGVKMEYLRDKFHKAQHSATEEVSFKTKHLNMFVDAAITWIRQKDWKASNTTTYTEEDLIGRECYGGLDLASTTDLAAFVLVFPMGEGVYAVLCRFFVPKENAMERAKIDKVSYLDWIKEGHITATEGNVIDYDIIHDAVTDAKEKFDLREVAFDRWNSHALVNNLEQEGVVMVGFGQGFRSMSSPIKELESLVLQKKLMHGNNPVLTWNIANCVIIKDPADNVKLDKSKSIEKIDGAVALAMAIGRAGVHVDDTPDVESLIG